MSIFAFFYSIWRTQYHQEFSGWFSDMLVWVAWVVALLCLIVELTITVQLIRAWPDSRREQ